MAFDFLFFTFDSAPLKDTYRMPGEFERHDGCRILWPEWTDNRHRLSSHIRVVEMSYNDAWIRDCGPGCAARFGLYFPRGLDDLVAGKVCDREDIDVYEAPMALEGGSIHTDAQGTLLTTEKVFSELHNKFPGKPIF